ncbi:class I SAM-dependent methyltransferase [Shewanella alkalitolerans]|uniref:class I SAM-dependent methyltransferase n=1 Tax=Shewanella alkalitolerans TaxID=2864209 RepID=UPI001C658CEE|nr:class I SAM-dependent methyltransferase [Shewanella alkalitolerans]QYJ97106.1 class I SAM-dependent methyltransferase [Shewanella alkalitolerans]
MLSNPSQVVLRNIELFESKNVLLINHECDLLATALLEDAAKVTTLALDFNHFQRIKSHENARLQCHFGHQLPSTQTFDAVVLFYPKSKSLAPYLINLAGRHLIPGGELVIVGEKKGGIRSITKQLPDYFDGGIKLDNARHCMLYSSSLLSEAPEIKLSDWVKDYVLSTPQGELTICNLVGVFSEKRLDEGTELLLEHLPTLKGRVLDFGCGAGVITAALLKANPDLELECVDINAMALASCELTLAANGMQAKVYASDGLTQTQGMFDAIISNPPFHDGLDSTTEIATRFVQESEAQLKSGGIFQIVANRHLPYSDTVAKFFKTVNVAAENNKYKIYANRKA